MSTLPPREEDGQGIGAVASSEYMIANDGGEYDRQQDIIRRRRLFLAVAALLVLALLGGLVSVRRVLQLDPIRATTAAGRTS